MSNEAIQYTESKEYLPDFLKDFHDQKDLFKAIHELYKNNESLQKMPQSWVDNHIFVMDYFLWFMGQHGYKLQKVRKKGIKFFDLHATIEEMNGRRGSALLKILQENKQQSNENRP
jgi:imidazoleglycerol phosphate dehydratase HisB